MIKILWSLGIVLCGILKQLWDKITCNKQTLSIKMLTLKITVFLALTSASRCSEIRQWDIRFYTKSERKFCFNQNLYKLLLELEFECFQSDDNICVFETLEEYIFCVKPCLKKSNYTQLLLSRIEPHSTVKTCTWSWWICQVFKYAGINTKMFTSHPWGSTLKAKTLGVYLSQIFKKGQWSNKSPWQKFYNKEIFPETTTFQSILVLWTEDKFAFGDIRRKVGRIQHKIDRNFMK